MGLKVYNTQSRQKEEFVPIEGNHVNFYTCGVTVYDMCHIGHARAAITFDVVYRYLRYKGYDVNFVRNFTDIDDKIINRSNERGIEWSELAEQFIGEFYTDMDALGVLRPTHEPRATEHMERIVSMTEALVASKHAYATKSGDVYFAVHSFSEYGKLSKRNLDELEAGARVRPGEEKRDPADFALWKAGKPGEPSWESPWGPGRPGWHIECSAMSTALCGPTLDIHGGGKDLVFPHHENEIAQSECATGRPFVKYWLHNGFVNVDHEKMSKSLGNFFTIREIRAKAAPEAIRHFLLGTHYRNPIDFTDQYLQEAETAIERFYTAWEAMDAALDGYHSGPSSSDDGMHAGEAKVFAEINRLRTEFIAAMDDDFNTARAVGCWFELVRIVNSLSGQGKMSQWPKRLPLLAKSAGVFHLFNSLLGSLIRPPADYRAGMAEFKLAGTGLTPELIEQKLAERIRARAAKDWAEADRIRDELAAAGVQIKDGKDGTTWTAG